ncbi:hypothetical protein HS088_TW21G00078 [Tripterygium wilfordii]|uniref:Uncharacterized protein n=1 Tax=Tripterygium wilfordii TaxID=458696 RepID=A0A7J7C1F9_TRIWF|nr:uncharacterized protein LOC119988293 [Tripterygium wilfordii]KAF5727938.1 hypothetical protein HS088_TW21G00078 [Tripterygium wilfordii]
MEGVGSRLGRASSRYGPAATASVFSGPVRKWKKRWVNVSPSPAIGSQSQSNVHRRSNGNGSNNGSSSRLVLCRWTPLPTTTAAADDEATPGEEAPPKRRFRYIPVSVIEEQKRRSAKNDEDEANKSEISLVKDSPTSEGIELNADPLKKDAQDSEIGRLDLGLSLKGHTGDRDSIGQNKDSQLKSASSGGFWTMA